MPVLTIFAGVNGAGKSTLHNYLDQQHYPQFGVRICPDEILREQGGDWANRADQMRSGKVALERIKECLEKRKSFNWETTILTNFNIAYIKKAKELGYHIRLNFIGVGDVNLSLQRLEDRVLKGGHGIDEKIVHYRFNHQFDHLSEVLPYLDHAIFFNNENDIEIVGTYFDKTLTFHNVDAQWARDLKHNLELHSEADIKTQYIK